MKRVESYIQQVTSGSVLTGKYEKLAVERYQKDLKEGIDRGLWFDKQAANKALRWFSFLRHSKGSQFQGSTFELEGWQAFIVANLFGWKRSNGTRRFSKGYVSVAKKNGKSTFAGGIGLYMLRGDGESRAEIYSAATTRDQAKIVWEEAKNMVKVSPGLMQHFSLAANSIYDELSGSYFKPLSADYDKQDGINPHFAIVDEYHAHKTDGMVDNIQSATVARTQPLILFITTAGFQRTFPCYEEEQVCKKILEGILEQDDKFAMIFALDEGDDWEDPTLWRKANPNLDVSLSLNKLMDEYKNAKNNNRKIVNFQTKNLNMWVDSSITWIKHKDWIRCSQGFDKQRLIGRRCWGGLDLAAHVDFNALSLVFEEDPDGFIDIIVFFWIPEGKMDTDTDRVDYRTWKRDGWFFTTPGNVIDIDSQVHDILKIINDYQVETIAFDPARAYHGVTQALQEEGINMVEYRQRTVDMDAPTRELEKLVLSEKLRHEGSPVMAWMISNVEIFADSSGNIKPSKGKSREKIDGVVSAVMALGVKMTDGYTNYINFS